MSSRRGYLAGLASIGVGGLAGCAESDEPEPRRRVELENSSDSHIEAVVEVTDEADETLFRESFAIEAGNRVEDTDWFQGVPAEISVAVGYSSPLTAAWPSRVTEVTAGGQTEVRSESTCASGGDSVTGVLARIASPESMRLEPTCEDPP